MHARALSEFSQQLSCKVRQAKLVKEIRYAVNTMALSEFSQQLQGQSSETREVSQVSREYRGTQ